MGHNVSDQYPADTFGALLRVDTGDIGLTTGLKPVGDSVGQVSPLSISTVAVSITATQAGSNIDGVPIGQTSPAAGAFTTLTASTFSASGFTSSAVAITGGTINGTVIGGTTPAAGTFTTIAATAGTLNNVTIGNVTRSSGGFTTITATGTVTAQALVDISATTAGQIKFPAAQNASSDPNTLDDYEEGTWTPTITFVTPGDLNVIYSAQQGSYTKIGNLVTVMCLFTTSTFTFTTASGNCRISTLPFTSASSPFPFCSGSVSNSQGINDASTNYRYLSTQVGNATTILSLKKGAFGQTTAVSTATDFTTGTTVALQAGCTYFTA